MKNIYNVPPVKMLNIKYEQLVIIKSESLKLFRVIIHERPAILLMVNWTNRLYIKNLLEASQFTLILFTVDVSISSHIVIALVSSTGTYGHNCVCARVCVSRFHRCSSTVATLVITSLVSLQIHLPLVRPLNCAQQAAD